MKIYLENGDTVTDPTDPKRGPWWVNALILGGFICGLIAFTLDASIIQIVFAIIAGTSACLAAYMWGYEAGYVVADKRDNTCPACGNRGCLGGCAPKVVA